ncbi:hypothetical protein DK419_13170 [Methylobacterium terrae]|uniref:Uncharacterized protein n=1 Tax=Methylobacterium terrae TaxID=2202827 RepID=A0A2U8WLW3_9HYPH|nr:hypothetical protein [Methylobacterium terrae]AWN47147.1 hypothetical protein DK419_13170 [Methylobacterium terrae]
MSLFLVAATISSAPLIEQAVNEKYANENYRLERGQWIVSAHGMTVMQVAKSLGIGEENAPNMLAIVVLIANYWGRHDRDLWEWMKIKLEDQHG